MGDRVITTANLNYIENNLKNLNYQLNTMNNQVETVDKNVQVVYQELADLAQEFRDYVEQANKQHYISIAETRLVKIRQEIENKFGHYDNVRRTTIGILQADDLEMIRKETITLTTEELMLNSPNYWLAPCLVGIAAWINNQKELAERSVKEAISRNDEKTSLLFALLCRRIGRKQASMKWAYRYLCSQDEEKLDRETIVIIDAFSSGLLGADTEGLVSRKLTEWLDKISAKPGFVEKQKDQWSEAISLYRPNTLEENVNYPYLKKYSATWPKIENILKGAYLHRNLLAYFVTIFNTPYPTKSLKNQLDDVLFSLVSNYDVEELGYRKDEKLNEFIIQYEGDLSRAQNSMKAEETSYQQNRDFSQLLTDAAMKPKASGASPSTQKLAIALSKEWINEAYLDVVAKNRMNIPYEIEFMLQDFSGNTQDGSNEEETVNRYSEYIEENKMIEIEKIKPNKVAFYAGLTVAGIGILMSFTGVLIGVIAIIGGGYWAYKTYLNNNLVETRRQETRDRYDEMEKNGVEIIRAVMAEVVDFRKHFEEVDGESQQVIDYMEQISPEQYVASISGNVRKIIIKGKE